MPQSRLQSQFALAGGASPCEQTLGDSGVQWQTRGRVGMRLGANPVSGWDGTEQNSSPHVGRTGALVRDWTAHLPPQPFALRWDVAWWRLPMVVWQDYYMRRNP